MSMEINHPQSIYSRTGTKWCVYCFCIMTRWVHIYQRLPILERVIKKTKFRSMLCCYFISFYKDSPTRYARHRREHRKEESESNVTCSLSVCQCMRTPGQPANAEMLISCPAHTNPATASPV